jgi:folate-binding protein YgfZ
MQLEALLNIAAIAPLDDTGWIRVTGSDRVRWLNGMVTNNIQALRPGEGNYNFVLNAQGRIQGDLVAWMQEDSVLLETSRDQLDKLLAHLDHFIIMDDVELADITSKLAGLCIAGPRAHELLVPTGFDPAADGNLRISCGEDTSSFIVCGRGRAIPRYEVWSSSPQNYITVSSALRRLGATPVSSEALEALRILEGTPRYGIDIRNNETAHDLPQETGQTRALHFSKGCYLGQEIVERIRSRGNVHRTFSGFSLTGALPEPGAVLTAEGKPVGELTSVAAIPLPESSTQPAHIVQLALGYVRREALPVTAQARNLPIEYPGGVATPTALPYPIP